MPPTKRRGGQPGRSGKHSSPKPGAGRKNSALRNLESAIKKELVLFSPGDVGSVMFDGSFHYCALCGAWAWEPFTARLWDGEGEQLTSVSVAAQAMRHGRKCGNR